MTALPIELRLFTSLVLATSVVYLVTPVAIRLATRFDLYDRPLGHKGHATPTPYLGGAAVMVGFLLALALTAESERTLPVAGGALLLWAIGTIDDRRSVAPILRVVVELALAGMLWRLDLGWHLGAGSALDLFVTCIWIVAIVNALNLFDNMDGQATTMGFVIATTLALLGALDGQAWLAVASAALAGACLGFLPHNLSSPSRIFLGDGGSMPIGFALAALIMIGAGDAAPEWQALAMGLLLVGVPVIDTGLVMISRRRRGISVMTGGHDHLTHRTHDRLRTARAVALALGGGQAILATLALVSYRGGSIVLFVIVVGYLVTAGVLIALLDSPSADRSAAPERGQVPGRPPPASVPLVPGSWSPTERLSSVPWEAALLVPLGLVIALAPLASGYYDSSLWAPAGLVLMVALVATLIARPPRLARSAVIALTGLTALGMWSLASASWAESVRQALVDGNRILVYAVTLALLLVLVRSKRAAVWLIATLSVATSTFVLVEVVQLALGDGASRFIDGRLHEPLGYINGLGMFHLLALWPALALAEHRTRPLLAGVGLAVAGLTVPLMLLSQSRGVALSATVTTIAVLTLLPGRVRRAYALLALGVSAALVAGPVTSVYRSGVDGTVDTGLLQGAMQRALLVALLLGICWGLATLFVARVAESRPHNGAKLRSASIAALAGVVAVAAIGGIAMSGRLQSTIERQYAAFVQLSPDDGGEATSSRLISGGGNRYDYWRIAVRDWQDDPIVGVGAGNYDRRYFLERTTTEDIRQPHSLPLQALGELGLVGGGFLAAFMVAIFAAVWRRRRLAVAGAERYLYVAATGSFCSWLVQTSVDWMHLLPGITAAALVSAAVLLRPAPPAETAQVDPPRAHRTRAVGLALVAAAILALGGLSLSRQMLSEHYARQAATSLVAEPEAALRQADRALRLAPDFVPAHYTRAAALARSNDADGARNALLEALRHDRGDFVTWALLGDLEVRAGNLATARSHYAAALRRNPRDPALQRLVADPRRALEGG